MVNWKKLLIWVAIIIVALLILGAISKKGETETDTTPDAEAETPDAEDTGVEGEVDGLTEADLNELEQDLNDLSPEDLGGLE